MDKQMDTRNLMEFVSWAGHNRQVYGYLLCVKDGRWWLERESGRDGKKIILIPEEVGLALAKGWRRNSSGPWFSGRRYSYMMLNALMVDSILGPQVVEALACNDIGRVYREVYRRTIDLPSTEEVRC